MEQDNPVRQAAIENAAISRMEWEGGPAIPVGNPVGRVLDERHPDTHPLAKVVLKREAGPVTMDIVDLRSSSAMEGKE